MFCCLRSYVVQKPQKNDKIRKNYNKGNFEAATRELETFDWKEYFSDYEYDVDTIWRLFMLKLRATEDKYVPNIKCMLYNRKHRYPLDSITKTKIMEKNTLARKAKKGNDPEVQKEYRRVRNCVRLRTRHLRKSYEEDLARQSKHKPKVIWNYINKRTKIRTSVGDLYVNQDNKNSSKTENDSDKAEILANYFSSVFVNEPEGHVIPELPRVEVQNTESFIITTEDTKKLLQSMNIYKSPGPDAIHPRIVKELACVIAEPLAMLFNKTLEEATLPCGWKEAQISAIFKKGSKALAGNYRPVSLTSVICKTMEKLIRDYIVEHMKSNRLFSNKQYGFISGRSTSLQLLTVLDKWSAALDGGQSVDCIYMDFQKAFDKVPHKRLISKLRSYCLDDRVICWIQDFLSNRKQQVVVNGATSDWKSVTSGVPQGSVLGPVLFVIYINDLPSVIHSDVYLFADDTKIFRIIEKDTDTAHLQADLQSMSSWCDRWLLKLNPDKCKHLHIGKGSGNLANYTVGDLVIHKIEEEKDIGVVVDNSLEFQTHISEKVKKANSMLAIIRRTFLNLRKELFIPLYKSLVRSHLEFASSVWCPYKIKFIEKIEKVQRRATKLIPGLKDLSYEERLRHLQLPSLVYRRHRGDMIEVYKLVHQIYDSTAEPVVHFWDNKYELRGNSLKLVPQNCHSEKRRNSFTLRAVRDWNKLPEEVVQAPSVNTFKNRLDKFWLTKDFLYNYRAGL